MVYAKILLPVNTKFHLPPPIKFSNSAFLLLSVFRCHYHILKKNEKKNQKKEKKEKLIFAHNTKKYLSRTHSEGGDFQKNFRCPQTKRKIF